MALLDRILAERNKGAAPERDTSTVATGKREPAAPDAVLPSQEQSGAKTADANQVAAPLQAAAPEAKPAKQELPAPAPEPVAKAPPPPKPIIKVPADDKQITETVEAAARVSVPVDALEIWDHFLARHTFSDALRIIDPSDPAHVRTFDAQFVAMSDDYDVALLKCPELKAPAVPLANELPKRGSEVLVLGYPQTESFGRNLKTTRGVITSLPDPTQPGDLKHMLLFDAAANPGNSGGPVCDGFGRAVALLTIATTQGDFIQYTGGVPTQLVLPFLQQQIPDLNALPPEGARLEWPDVDAKVSPSTVLIMAFYKGVVMKIDVAENPGAAVPDRENLLEDVSCSVCNGHARLPCPQDGCDELTDGRTWPLTPKRGTALRRPAPSSAPPAPA